jgi:3-phenylpropionate/cinnamic acid dioxygenase small subunit
MNWEDYHAIEQLLYKYPEFTDTGNFEGVGELFAHCAMVEGGKVRFKAIDAKDYTSYYQKWVRRYSDSGTPKTRHVMSNISIAADGPDRAKARSYVSVFQRTEKLPLQPIVVGTYHDKFEKIAGTWRFAERAEEMELIGDCSQHLLMEWQ